MASSKTMTTTTKSSASTTRFPETPLELAAKLNRAVALAELLNNAQCPPKRTVNNTLYVITGLI